MERVGAKLVRWGYGIFMGLILAVLVAADFFDYPEEKTFLLPNTLVMGAVAAVIFGIFIFKKRRGKLGVSRISGAAGASRADISDKKFFRILIGAFIAVFFVQLVMMHCIYLYTGWDPGNVLNAAEQVIETGSLGQHWYFSYYPNNLMLVFFLVLIKSVPVLGTHYEFLLAVNVALVAAAGVMATLTIRRFTSNRTALFTLFLMIPFFLLNPWLVIPYSDTFAVLFPITILYIYTKPKKSWVDYLIAGICAVVGFKIKPTVIIVPIAITIVEAWKLVAKKGAAKKLGRSLKKGSAPAMAFVVGILGGMLIGKVSGEAVGFQKNEAIPQISFIHYLAMGQNDATNGGYSEEDFYESGAYGNWADIQKFFRRLTARNLGGQIQFFAGKAGFNFNDGTFKWGGGELFYQVVPERNDGLSRLLRDIFYDDGAYFRIWQQVIQVLWVITLIGGLLAAIFVKKIDKKTAVLMLSLFGFITFLMIFEPQARYVYCFAPVFITAAAVGYKAFLEGGKRAGKN